MIERIWDGIVAAARFGNRCLNVVCVVTAGFGALVYLGGSGHAGHLLNIHEFEASIVNALVWMTEGMWR